MTVSFTVVKDGARSRLYSKIGVDDVNGIRIDGEGEAAGGDNWKAIYVDGTGMTSSAGGIIEGLRIDLSGVVDNTGGILGATIFVPGISPILTLVGGAGSLTVVMDASNYAHVWNGDGRIYFNAGAGAGSATSNNIYCKNVYQTAPWAENTWDDIDDLAVLKEINAAVGEGRTPGLPEAFMKKFAEDGYYNGLHLDAVTRGAILSLLKRVEELEAKVA